MAKISFKPIKGAFILLAYMLLSTVTASAQPGANEPRLSADKLVICDGRPLTLTVTPEKDPDVSMLNPMSLWGFPGLQAKQWDVTSPSYSGFHYYYVYQYTYEEGPGATWINANTSETKDKVFAAEANFTVVDGDGNMVTYDKMRWRVVRQPYAVKDNNGNSSFTMGFGMPINYPKDDKSKNSKEITIERDKSEACGRTCHTSSTGDYIMGTDFDPQPGSSVVNPEIPQPGNNNCPTCVYDYFNDYTIGFQSNGTTSYTVTDDLNSFFGGYTPKMDNGGNQNYYYTFEKPNGEPFKLTFPYTIYKNQYYDFRMRMYIQRIPGCGDNNNWSNAMLTTRTGHGNITNDSLECTIYNDATDEVLFYELVPMEDVARIRFGEKMKANGFDFSAFTGLMRVEITFHGKFPDRNQDYFFQPEFAQMECARVAVDYISADVLSVCMSPNIVCLGGSTDVNVTGFPRTATYSWQEKDEFGNWVVYKDADGNPVQGKGLSMYTFTVNHVGVKPMRVIDVTPPDGEDAVFQEFELVGKRCDPEAPEDINGPEQICIPTDSVIVYSPYPVNNNPEFYYVWHLFDTDSVEITDPSIVYFADPTNTANLSVKYPSNAKPGKYTLVTEIHRSDNDALVPNSTFASPIKLYTKPSAKFLVEGGSDQICPFRQDVFFEANDKDTTNHGFAWTNAIAVDTAIFKAKISIPADACADGSKYNATLIVNVKEMPGCADTSVQSMEYDKKKPVIKCDEIGVVTEYQLAPTADDTLITLPLPEVTATCDTNPTIVIEAKGVDVDKNPINLKIEGLLVDLKKDDTKHQMLLPASAGKVGDGSFRVTYVAKDGCGQESDSCIFNVTVRDTAGPDVNCDEIPNKVISDSLSHYPKEICEAIPGQGNPLILPVLSAPTLEDRLHPGRMITGKFGGRYINDTLDHVNGTPKALNDAYPIGTTTIIWHFADAAGNVKDCDQTVTVIDDKMPEVQCPSLNEFEVFPDDEGCTVSAQSLVNQIRNQLGTDIPRAWDRCEDSVELSPRFFWKAEGGEFAELDTTDTNLKFEMKILYHLEWRFYKQAGVSVDTKVYAKCEETFKVIDDKKPLINCDTIQLKKIPALKGTCIAPLSAVIDSLSPVPVAYEACTGDPIPGVLMMADGSPLPESFPVGDTVHLMWVFADRSLTTGADTCPQKLFILSSAKPVFNCDNIADVTTAVAPKGTCKAPLSVEALADLFKPWPTAKDSCTQKDIPGVILMADGTSLPDSLNVGDTIQVIWVFADPNITTESDTCWKFITAISSNKPIYDCTNIPDVTTIPTPEGKCETPLDTDVLESMFNPWPEAIDSCQGKTIKGIIRMKGGAPLPATLAVGDTLDVEWVFKDITLTTDSTVCEKKLTAIGNGRPQFNCSSLENLPPFIAHGTCEFVPSEGDIETPIAKDSCTNKDVPGRGVRLKEDGSYDTKSLSDPYFVGFTTIRWYFESPWSTRSDSCDQKVWVLSDKEMDTHCNKDSFPDITVKVEDGCSTDAENVWKQIRKHFAEHPCLTDADGNPLLIPGRPVRNDGKDSLAAFSVGTWAIDWIFKDTTKTLVDSISVCSQVVIIDNGNAPVVDCDLVFPRATLYTDQENCTMDFKDVPVNIDPENFPVDPCNGDTAKLDSFRVSGKAMHDPYEVGIDTIVWTFSFENHMTHTCKQVIEVVDTVAPYFNCDTLKPVITIELREKGATFATFQQVVDSGFFVPKVTEDCDSVITIVSRSDNQALEANFPMNSKTKITFEFKDEHNNSSFCSQLIVVTDMIKPEVKCPVVTDGDFTCILDTPAAYKTYEEFIAAGGSVNEPEKIIPSSFFHKDVINGDECAADVIRNYFFLTVRGDTVGCENPMKYSATDTVKPYYDGIPASGLTKITTCDALDTVPPVVKALDECDPNPTLKFSKVSTQGSDPSQCDYYTYDVTYTWQAIDRCDNAAAPVKYVVHVVDTVGPEIRKPYNWDNPMYPEYLGNCEFGVPDIRSLIPLDSIDQNCGDNRFLKFTQQPEPGTKITETTIIHLFITDVCGNPTELTKTLLIQPRKAIVDVLVNDDVHVCGSDEDFLSPVSAEANLSNSHIRDYSGEVMYEEDGEWVPVPTTVFWDYYRGSISPKNIVYSNNELTYGPMFKDAEDLSSPEGLAAFAKYNLLPRRSFSDVYFFVAYDTITGCSDTASTYIDVRERPRISIATGEWNICEGDPLEVNGDFGNANPYCLSDMGAEVEERGWLINGEKYVYPTPVNYDEGKPHTVLFYATNVCGTTTSAHTLFTNCLNLYPTYEDSLALVNGDAKEFEKFASDQLYTNDSIKLNVYTRYKPEQVLLSTTPADKARVWEGDNATLTVSLPYTPSYFKWMQVEGRYDLLESTEMDKYGNIVKNGTGEEDDIVLSTEYSNVKNSYELIAPEDSSLYYVLVGNGVCPTVSSNLVSIDVIKKLPTAITPYTVDGLNDVFMKGHLVVIFNRYGQEIFTGNDGWDGTYRGLLADPGVYFYEVVMHDGTSRKGSIEIVKINQ